MEFYIRATKPARTKLGRCQSGARCQGQRRLCALATAPSAASVARFKKPSGASRASPRPRPQALLPEPACQTRERAVLRRKGFLSASAMFFIAKARASLRRANAARRKWKLLTVSLGEHARSNRFVGKARLSTQEQLELAASKKKRARKFPCTPRLSPKKARAILTTWGIDKRRFAMLVFARLTDLRAYGGSALESRLALRLSALGSASLASLPFPNIMCGEAGACWLCALPCPNRSAPDDGHDRKSRVPQGQIGAPLLRDTLSQVALP